MGGKKHFFTEKLIFVKNLPPISAFTHSAMQFLEDLYLRLILDISTNDTQHEYSSPILWSAQPHGKEIAGWVYWGKYQNMIHISTLSELAYEFMHLSSVSSESICSWRFISSCTFMAHSQPYILQENPKTENKRSVQELSSHLLNPLYFCPWHQVVNFVDLRDLKAVYSPLPPLHSYFGINWHVIGSINIDYLIDKKTTLITDLKERSPRKLKARVSSKQDCHSCELS